MGIRQGEVEMAANGDGALSHEDRLRAAIGPRADYYLRRWREMDEKGGKISWNWAACFANAYWLIFRRMWLALVLFVLANVAVSALGAATPGLARYTPALLVLLTFVTGAFGNHLYRRQIETLVASGAAADRLKRRGGTSALALIVALALTAGLAALAAKPMLEQIEAQRAARLRST
jgi:hypothetical protein